MKATRRTLVAAGIALVLAAPTAFGQVFTVNSTADAVTTEADGQCNATVGEQTVCTLREAIMEANALAGPDEIQFDSAFVNAANPIQLTLGGVDEGSRASPEGSTDPFLMDETPDVRQGDLDVTDSLTITGVDPSRPDATVIEWNAPEGESPDRIFQIHGSTDGVDVKLQYLTLRGGSVGSEQLSEATETNGAWWLYRNGGAIANGVCCSIIEDSTSEDHGGAPDGVGGGDEGEEGSAVINGLTLERVVVLANHAEGDGGGIYSAAPLVLNQSAISGNISSRNGGGLYNDSDLTMTETTVGAISNVPYLDPSILAAGNEAEGGGGIFDTGSHTSKIDRSAIIGNVAVGGGGIAGRAGVIMDISNSTIAGNQAADVGGGVYTNGTVNLTNVTVVDNQAPGDAGFGGAGLHAFSSGDGDGNYHLVNTLLAHNLRTTEDASQVPANCGVTGGTATVATYFQSSGNNMEDADTCAFSQPSDHVNTDAKLGLLSNNGGLTETVPLMEGSPAVDAGNNALVAGTLDQRGTGFARTNDGNGDGVATVDVGAFEAAAVTPATPVVPPSDITDGTSSGGGGGGCTVNPHGADPTLPALLAAALGFLGWRRSRRQQ
ncbi:MAG: CSLREA domain-containing protein [Gammaproteobacteria bacterium]